MEYQFTIYVNPVTAGLYEVEVPFNVTCDIFEENPDAKPVYWVDTLTWDRGLFDEPTNKQIEDSLNNYNERYRIENEIMELVRWEHEPDYN